MKLNKIIAIALLISTTLVLAGCGLTKKNTEPVEDTSMLEESYDENMGQEKEEKIAMEVPEGARVYKIEGNSEVSYTVNKEFFNKPSVLVTGRTNSVTGMGYVDFEGQKYALEAEVDLFDLATDSTKRDSDIQPLFGSQKAEITLVSIDGAIEEGVDFSTSAVIAITVNGKTQEVPFDIEGTFSEDTLKVTGTGKVSIEGFGIINPSAEGVFEVQDEVELKFNIEAKTEKMENNGTESTDENDMEEGTEAE